MIIESNLNRVRLSCCWVGVGLGCDNTLPLCVYLVPLQGDEVDVRLAVAPLLECAGQQSLLLITRML